MTDSLTQRLWDWRVWKSRGPTWLRAIEWLLNIEILIQKWILDTIKNGWMILTLKYFVQLKKALWTDNQRSSPRRLSSNKMTNVYRFAIYLRFFHPRDLWSEGDQNLCQSSERFRVPCCCDGQTEAVLSIIRTTMNQLREKYFTGKYLSTKNIYLSRRGREAGGGEGQLAIHLRPGEGNLDCDLVQVSLAIQRLVQGPAGLG